MSDGDNLLWPYVSNKELGEFARTHECGPAASRKFLETDAGKKAIEGQAGLSMATPEALLRAKETDKIQLAANIALDLQCAWTVKDGLVFAAAALPEWLTVTGVACGAAAGAHVIDVPKFLSGGRSMTSESLNEEVIKEAYQKDCREKLGLNAPTGSFGRAPRRER